MVVINWLDLYTVESAASSTRLMVQHARVAACASSFYKYTAVPPVYDYIAAVVLLAELCG